MSVVEKVGSSAATAVDQRLGSNSFLARNLKKVFPDHWSFMLGEIALYSFLIVLLSGVYLTLFYVPSMAEVVYDGSYVPLKGIYMSEAYASTLDISFEIRGGLLIRQIHHWGALIFVAAVVVHMFRVFFTAAFRKPRELNWIIGVALTALALGAGFTGYSLPDDLLSGTGLQIIRGILQAIPLIGTWLAFFVFGGEYPGGDIISRLYSAHILLIPGLILGLVTVHLMMVWVQKHTQFPGPGRTNTNVVGYPLLPVYMAKAGGFFFIVFGIITVLSAMVTINPLWIYGPYTPDQVTAGTQPDWYIGWLDGALRLMPNWETVAFGYTFSWNILIPAVILPGLLFTLLAAYPFLEAWVTGDKREHHLLDRPRNAPVRTGIGMAAITFYCILWLAGGNDLMATAFDLSINAVSRFLQISLIIAPPIVFLVTKRLCLSLQRKDRAKLLHGYETGRVLRLPSGEFTEVHAPVSAKQLAVLQAAPDPHRLQAPARYDQDGVRNPRYLRDLIRYKLASFYYSDQLPPLTASELAEIEALNNPDLELTSGDGLEETSPSANLPVKGGL